MLRLLRSSNVHVSTDCALYNLRPLSVAVRTYRWLFGATIRALKAPSRSQRMSVATSASGGEAEMLQTGSL
jgi:hypothetical protein